MAAAGEAVQQEAAGPNTIRRGHLVDHRKQNVVEADARDIQ